MYADTHTLFSLFLHVKYSKLNIVDTQIFS